MTPPATMDVQMAKTCQVNTVGKIELDINQASGSVTIKAISPSYEAQSLPISEKGSKYEALFSPKETGDWAIIIFFEGRPIKEEPYFIQVYDPSKAHMIHTVKSVPKGTLFSFEVDCLDVGLSDITANVVCRKDSSRIKPRKVPAGIDKTAVQFVPENSGIYTVSVFVSGMEIEGSPFNVGVTEKPRYIGSPKKFDDNYQVAELQSGPVVVPAPVCLHLKEAPEATSTIVVNVALDKICQVDCDTIIEVHSSQAGGGEIRIQATSPSYGVQDLTVTKGDNFKYEATLTPNETGEWLIDVLYEGQAVVGNPYVLMAYNPYKAKIIKKHGLAGQGIPYSYEVDCVDVGINNVSANISTDNSPFVKYNKVITGVDKYAVQFTPEELGIYTISAFVGGIQLNGSPFEQEVAVLAMGPGLESPIVKKSTRFDITCRPGPNSLVKVTITDPKGNRKNAEAVPVDNTKYRVTYIPEKVGSYKIEVMYNKTPINGSPFEVVVREPIVYVKGLKNKAPLNTMSQFEVDASEIQKGKLEFDGTLPLNACDRVGKRAYRISFTPDSKGEYKLIVKCNKKEITGSPFKVEVEE